MRPVPWDGTSTAAKKSASKSATTALRTAVWTAGVAFALAAGGCSTASHDPARMRVASTSALGGTFRSGVDGTMDEVIALMTGTFTSDAQAKASADFHPIVLHMTEIWTRFSANPAGQRDGAARGERWLYVEQAVTTATERPYRQRVYRLTPLVWTDVNGATQVGVRSEVWELPGDPLRYAGAWRSVDPLADIGPESLSLKDGCEVVLFRGVDGAWRGSTVGDGCASSRQGAAYTTSMVEINAQGLKTLDRGFDAKGAQAWGSEHGAYEFVRK